MGWEVGEDSLTETAHLYLHHTNTLVRSQQNTPIQLGVKLKEQFTKEYITKVTLRY